MCLFVEDKIMERVAEVKVLLVENVCEVCKIGTMQQTDMPILLSNPPKWEHKCTYCEHRDWYTLKYPYQKFEKVN
ncbi:hypothetical protein AHMF7605_11855 [Adhaeribacter arboris]|uniref:Uncharacterized protein n=1 Tax=Adhaeribacter arboris TaxID=2072846 RepID=A0A2T2YF67_9BACT|nr:hypothetical protein AHMF7605_11855 [Adhaeribacter arboris]